MKELQEVKPDGENWFVKLIMAINLLPLILLSLAVLDLLSQENLGLKNTDKFEGRSIFYAVKIKKNLRIKIFQFLEEVTQL